MAKNKRVANQKRLKRRAAGSNSNDNNNDNNINNASAGSGAGNCISIKLVLIVSLLLFCLNNVRNESKSTKGIFMSMNNNIVDFHSYKTAATAAFYYLSNNTNTDTNTTGKSTIIDFLLQQPDSKLNNKTIGDTKEQKSVDFNGCQKYTKLIHLLESNHNHETSLCAFYEYNPGQNLTLLKVASDLSYVHSHLQSITGAQQMAERYNYSLVVYLAQKSDYHPGRPHFSKIKGIELALFALNYPWVFFTDLDFIYRPRSAVSVQHTIDTAPSEVSLIIQRENVICSCMHLWRNTNWTRDFLRQWWYLGVTKQCCPQHAFDQIAFQGLLANYTALGLPLTQRRYQKYGIAIRGSSNPNFYVTNDTLSGANWNFPRIQDPLFWHSGHQEWNNTVNMSATFEFVEQLPT